RARRGADVTARSAIGSQGRWSSCGGELGDRLEDPAIAGASAEVPGEFVLDRLLVDEIALLEQRADGEQHPRRAKAALERGVAGEDLLEAGELRPLGETFDRRHRLTVSVGGEVAARADRQPVHQHRAGAADLDVARPLGTGQAERVAE